MGKFLTTVQVRWSDLDFLGHANNIAYWRWCEDVRNLHAAAVGLGLPGLGKPSQILVASEAEYLRPVGLNDTLEVEREVLRIGRTSQKASYRISHNGTPVFKALCTVVLFDFITGKPHPYSDRIRAQILDD